MNQTVASWYEFQGTLRGSGRTTRMLERAAQEAAEGKAVYVVTHTLSEGTRLRLLYLKKHGGIQANNGIVHSGKGKHGFVRFMLYRGFDYRTLTFATTRSSDVVLVDHAAIESSFARMLEMLHMFDPPPSQADLIKDIT